MVDYYSRYPVIRRLNITTSNATIDILTQVFREHRVLKAVMPDNGTVKLLQASTALTGAACLSKSACWICNLVVQGSSPALANSKIFSQLSQVQIPGHACK